MAHTTQVRRPLAERQVVQLISIYSDYVADVFAMVEGPTVLIAGGTHEPFSAASCGQY